MNNTALVNELAAAVTKALEKTDFYNVPQPKPTKASTATQGAWNIEKNPKASAATEGAWDATNTPGGVSANAKKVWTVKDIEDSVRKAVAESVAFSNPVHPYPTKTSASMTQQINDPVLSGKTSASNTQQANGPILSGKTSASNTQQANGPILSGKISASTQPAWTAEQVEACVRKVLSETAAFSNPARPYPTKTSASNTQQINDPIPSGKTSASQTQQVNDPIPSGKVSASTIAQILTNVYKLQEL